MFASIVGRDLLWTRKREEKIVVVVVEAHKSVQ
jgi:hypothetical protein